MTFRNASKRRALWLFAAALLLKSAMPFLASASAHAQGKELVQICTVYGVSLVQLGSDRHEPAPADHPPGHAGDHCALSALTVLATTAPPALLSDPAPLLEAAPACPLPPAQAHDACARWIARLKQGPPTFA
jgi:hypothetical protein